MIPDKTAGICERINTMDTSSMFAFMDLLVIVAGIYVLYSFYLLKFKKEIKQGVLIPKDVNPKSCKDLEGYIGYMGPKTLVLGLAAIASGGVGLYNDLAAPVRGAVYWVVFGLFFAALIWFMYGTRKADKRFF